MASILTSLPRWWSRSGAAATTQATALAPLSPLRTGTPRPSTAPGAPPRSIFPTQSGWRGIPPHPRTPRSGRSPVPFRRRPRSTPLFVTVVHSVVVPVVATVVITVVVTVAVTAGNRRTNRHVCRVRRRNRRTAIIVTVASITFDVTTATVVTIAIHCI